MKGCGPIHIEGDKWRFSVWAPLLETMSLHLMTPSAATYPMKKDHEGYFVVECFGVSDGATYFFQPDDDGNIPDPASAFQPSGVHGYSAVVDHSKFKWNDQTWKGRPLKDLIIYELHVGTFSEEGTFDGVISHLDHLVDVGVNAIELMPVAQFPGKRNWGYDGVLPYAVQNSYGGPHGLKRLVDACHAKNIAVILDVVYNHMGPEGNYFSKYAPYFTKAYHVPWGDAINFDQQWSDGVRDYFVDNINYWIEHYHIDGLRLDAIHTIFDSTPAHILSVFNKRAKELQEKLGRTIFMIAESDLNDPKVIENQAIGGYCFDAQWLDDFHHALYTLVDPFGVKRYEDFGSIHQLAKAFTEGFVHSGEYVKFRKRKYGASSAGIDGDKFIVFSNNHDQVGNRVFGERMTSLVGKEGLMLTAAAIILSPYIPMLFMGEEYAEEAPFLYFVDHSDPELVKAVREGRKKEFSGFGDHEGDPPDAQDKKTFDDSKLRWNTRAEGYHAEVLRWYKSLIQLRKTHPVFAQSQKSCMQVSVIAPRALAIYRYTPHHTHEVFMFLNFGAEPVSYTMHGNEWKLLLSSTTGNLSKTTASVAPIGVAVYERRN
jgi:maltooligosyltrehalose trehalohydrolase